MNIVTFRTRITYSTRHPNGKAYAIESLRQVTAQEIMQHIEGNTWYGIKISTMDILPKKEPELVEKLGREERHWNPAEAAVVAEIQLYPMAEPNPIAIPSTAEWSNTQVIRTAAQELGVRIRNWFRRRTK